ncbi:hypothetical protein C7C46_28505 [Streptomyces tateyamensis]|uniref:Uncharacterized protein n=1 Tax=Streptomyces tateyamensis TaxID=565073 RepID=A0A2V4NUR9_9ACTN|nr:hypothetical protein [Streptomyces tateyamensis]PYC69057.1 hypothetical protein C7C46_28505 [Streptomyces tateyamensis]
MARARLLTSAATATAAGLLLAATAVQPAAALTPVQDPIPVRPGMGFQGLVNGKSVGAAIEMGCFGPITPGQTGHPLAGQYIEADTVVPSATTGGYTGSAGTSLVVSVAGSATGTVQLIGVLNNFYAPLPLPTSITLPCSGTAKVAFSPAPSSPTARDSVVAATLVSQP